MSGDDVSQNADDDVEPVQQKELEFFQKSLDSSTAQEVDSVTLPDQLGGSEENREGEQQVDDEQSQQQQQQLDAEDVEAVEKQHQLNDEEGESKSQDYTESANAQRIVEENERQSPQQPETDRPEISKAQTVSSQVQQPSETQDAQQQAERRAPDQQIVHARVQSKTSTSPEKKQQVAVVHGHERTIPRAEDRALSRIRDEERMFSMSRQPTIESHLSIESTSSHQLSQMSHLWRNEQSPAATRPQDVEQTVSLQQQYEQLKNQLQQQLELQRSQLEREYQLREEQMKQQMMMQWQCFTQQQQQQQQSQRRTAEAQVFSDVRQDADTHCQSGPRSSFPRAPSCTNVTSTCDPVAAQSAHPPSTEDLQRCGCDEVVQSNSYDAHAEPAKARQNYHEVRPVVVDVVSRTRGQGGAGRAGWSGYDGNHCRIIVGERQTTTNDDSSDVESLEPTGRTSSGPVEWRVCPTCGLCRHPCDVSDGKNVVRVRFASHADDPRAVHVVTAL